MKRHLFSVIYMFLVTLFFTSMVSAVKFFNEERIQINQNVKSQKIILKVLKLPVAENATVEDLSRIFEKRIREVRLKGKALYIGKEDDGQTIRGYAFPVTGPGFWGPIYTMVGVDANISKIIGIAFYKHSETPGLGGRITEDWFQNQFAGLKLPPADGGERIFRLKSVDGKKAPNEIDAITGATQTSTAVEAFLNRELGRSLEDLRQYVK
jgi:Na+-transporting NADH:ubiquinone oxidoreductase subunit C